MVSAHIIPQTAQHSIGLLEDVPTRTNPYQPPKKMQQSEIQAILCAYNCQLKIRRISPK